MISVDDLLKIGPIVISALILIVALYGLYRNHKVKRLSYAILINTAIVPLDKNLSGKIKLYFEENPGIIVPIEDSRILIIKFLNDGTVPIEPDHFVQSISVSFDPEVRIIDKDVIDYPDSIKKPELNLSENSIILDPMLFNKNEFITIKILLANSRTEPNVKIRARIIGISDIKEVKQKKTFIIDIIQSLLLVLIIVSIENTFSFQVDIPDDIILPGLFGTILGGLLVYLIYWFILKDRS
jgi:hypothetical protein